MIRDYEFGSLASFIEQIRVFRSHMSSGPVDVWFRGHADLSYQLLPGLLRSSVLDEERENTLLAEFESHYQKYTDYRATSGFELYSLMQHYGMPTRLLDWSTNPLVSLFFALNGYSENKDPLIWAMQPHKLNRMAVDVDEIVTPSQFSTSQITKYLPRQIRSNKDAEIPENPISVSFVLNNPRIYAQKGAYTFHGFSKQPVDYWLMNSEKVCAARFILKKGADVLGIIGELSIVGINIETVYCDLNSLSKRIITEYVTNAGT